MTPLLNVKDVAQFLSVSVMTVRRLVATGELPCVRLTKGGPLRFDLRDIEKFVERHKA